jgi:hypothetical protein
MSFWKPLLFRRKRFELHSPHSPSECVALLEKAASEHLILRRYSKALQGKRTVRILVQGDSVELTTKAGATTPLTVLEARLTPHGEGTRIEGHIRPDWATRIFARVILTFLALFGGGGFLVLLYAWFLRDPSPLGYGSGLKFLTLLIPLGFAASVLAFMAFCLKTDDATLTQFLQNKLNAKTSAGLEPSP